MRLTAQDAALVSPAQLARLGPWWHGEQITPAPWVDELYPSALVIDAAAFGLRPGNEGSADAQTAALQAAIDYAHDAERHGFIAIPPGQYWIETVFPSSIFGTTLWGYGATLKRPGVDWFIEKYGDDSRARSCVTINCFQYHPRIKYKWRGPGDSEPVRLFGLTLDGNAQNQRADYATHYSQQHAHLVQVGCPREAKGHVLFEAHDLNLRAAPADGIAVLTNAKVKARRIDARGVFRGAVNFLGANDVIDVEDLYATDDGLPVARGIDAEPQGSSAGIDPVTGEDTESSVRLYWTMRRAVLFGLDVSMRPPPGPASLHGGWFDCDDVYVISPVVNMLPYEGHMRFNRCLFRTGLAGAPIDRDDRRRFGESNLRWPRNAEFRDCDFILEVPSNAAIASAFVNRPALKTFRMTILAIDMTNNATPRSDLRATFSDCRWRVSEEYLSRPDKDPRVELRAILYNGNADQGHTVLIDRGSFDCSLDVAIHQYHGGRLLVQGADVRGSVYIGSATQGGVEYTAEVRAIVAPGSSEADVARSHNGHTFRWEIGT